MTYEQLSVHLAVVGIAISLHVALAMVVLWLVALLVMAAQEGGDS